MPFLPPYETYKNKYINEICAWQRNRDFFRPDQIYERLCAVSLGHILWRDLPPGFEDVKKLPHRNDYGVDSINLDYTETGQMKHYGPNSMVTWTKITNFLSYSKEILEIHKLFLCVTPEAKIDSMVERMMQKNSNQKILRLDFDTLLQDLSSPLLFLDDEDDKTKNEIQLRPYLVSAAEKILKDEKNVFYIEWPCGLGKTFLAYYLHINSSSSFALEKNKIDLFITPWISLGLQILSECKNLGMKAGIIGNGQDILQPDWKFVVCINLSVKKLALQLQGKKVRFKFLDEGHHHENEGDVSKLSASIACEKNIYLSATFHNSSKVDDKITIRDAIDMGYVCDYKIHLHFFTGNRFTAILNALKSNPDFFPAFVYFNSTQKAKDFAKALQKAGFRADFLIGTDTDSKKTRFKEQVENGLLDIGCLCGCMNEGESVFALKTVVFGDMRFSSINVRQVSQRGSRKHDSKPFYNIVFFIEKTVLDYDEMSENEEVENDFEDVKKIFKILSDEDPILKESIAKKSFTRFRFSVDNKEITDSDDSDEGCASILYHQIFDSLGMMISDSRLTQEQKVEELLNNNKDAYPLRTSKETFSDGSSKGTFWNTCKTLKKCDKAPWNKLLSLPPYKEDYERYCNRDILTQEQKVEELLNNNKDAYPSQRSKETFSDGSSKGKFWTACKSLKRCDKAPWNKLLSLPPYKEDYERCCNHNILTQEQKVEELLNNNKDAYPLCTSKETFSDGSLKGTFWSACKTLKRCDKAPWNKLLNLPPYKEDYERCCNRNKK